MASRERTTVIDLARQCIQSCCFSICSTLIPSFRASVLRACLTTAVCVIPSRSESFLSRILSASLNRSVVVLFIMLDIVAHCGIQYKYVEIYSLQSRRAGSGFVRTKKRLWRLDSAGAAMRGTTTVEASTEVQLSRFTTF